MHRSVIDIEAAHGRDYDACIVGSGPVGTACAITLARLGRRVLVVESGGLEPGPETQDLSGAEILSDNHADMQKAVCRALGGTSRWWGGRCVRFDAMDFEARDAMASSGWPISAGEVEPHYASALELLGCDRGAADRLASVGAERFPSPAEGIVFDNAELWANNPFTGQRLLDCARETGRIDIVLGATLTRLRVSLAPPRIAGLEVATHKPWTLTRARHTILALGGLETARILLRLQAEHPDFANGPSGALGRYYQGHVSGCIAELSLARPGTQRHFAFRRGMGSFLRYRMRLDDAVSRQNGLPNTAFWPENPRIANAAHRSGTLSLIYLVLASPLGRKLVAEAIRDGQVRDASGWGVHVGNLFLDLPRSMMGAADLLRQRLFDRRRHPLKFIESRSGRVPLHFHAEQRPDQDNRVVLSRTCDRLGVPRLSIAYKVSADDVSGCLRAHDELDRRLRASDVGRLDYRAPTGDLDDLLRRESQDGFHQIGVARMGEDPRRSVVNRDCAVHDLPGLYLAGSSVFPTSGQANPTLLAMALAIRLANRIDHELGRPHRSVAQGMEATHVSS